jgi:hypothetical protein
MLRRMSLWPIAAAPAGDRRGSFRGGKADNDRLMVAGPGAVYRTAASLQRRFVTAPSMRHAVGARSKYR